MVDDFFNWIETSDSDGFNQFIDPGDGQEPIPTWWDDMRPREVRELVKDAYTRGYQRGYRQGCLDLSQKKQG